MREIVKKELRELNEREGIKKANLSFTYTEKLLEHLLEIGFDKRYGARFLQRVLEQEVVTAIARFLIENPEIKNKVLSIDIDNTGKIKIC